MTAVHSLYHRIQRYRTLRSNKVYSLPIVILMPHSACNCRCIMCDIWKDNRNLKQLNEEDVKDLITALKKWGTEQVLMSGGEAILHPKFFRFCEMLRKEHISVSLLSTGLTLGNHVEQLLRHVNNVIISLDGLEETHNNIRNIPDAFQKTVAAIKSIKKADPAFRVTSRTVIHRLNFRDWPGIIETGKSIGLNQVSFLPADVSSHAFNREILWSDAKQHEILPAPEEIEEMREVTSKVILNYREDIQNGFIAEDEEKLKKIVNYYSAFYGKNPFPYKKCNAPWVSTVIEADGTVRPCFFHKAIGNIHENDLEDIVNGEKGIRFRKELDMSTDQTCNRCVCYLHLSPGTRTI
jgi:Fe-coproporphyrin III synthase